MKFKSVKPDGEDLAHYVSIAEEADGDTGLPVFGIETYDHEGAPLGDSMWLSVRELQVLMFAIRTFLLETKGAAFVNPEPSMIPIQRLPDDTQEI